jgi:protein-tyrosine phosphatase
VHLVPELPAALQAGKVMTFGDHGKAVLVELPVHALPIGAEAILSMVLAQGVTPVVAHPERNLALCDDMDVLERWVAMGCRAQVTVQSCIGGFGARIEQAARRMVERRLVHIAASDGHRPYNRVPQIAAGRQRIAAWTNDDVAELLTTVFPRCLLEGKQPDIALLGTGSKRPWWRRSRR